MDNDRQTDTTAASALRSVRRALLLLVLAASVLLLFVAALVAADDLSRPGEMFDGMMAALAAVVAVPVLAVTAVSAVSLRLMRTRPRVEPVVTLTLGGALTLVSVAGIFAVGVVLSIPLLVLAAALTAVAAPEAWPGPGTPESRAGSYRPMRPTR